MTDSEKKLIHPLFQRLQGRVIVAGNHLIDGDAARLAATLREAAQLLEELRDRVGEAAAERKLP